jgi:hypothetical protein
MPETEREVVPHLLGEVSVLPGTTYNGGNLSVAVINNRQYTVMVAIHELRPPAPPPTCPEWLDIDADDCCTISCDYTAVHEGPHRTQIGGNTVLWWPQNG